MTTLSVPDMTCSHCKATVESALGTLSGVEEVTVDLSTRKVRIAGPAPASALIAALDHAGYPASVA